MNCAEATRLVEKLADGEASAREKASVESHLEGCSSCRTHLEFVSALPAVMDRSRLAEPPVSYWDILPQKVVRRLDREARRSRFWTPAKMSWAGLAAAAMIVLVVGRSVYRDWQHQQAALVEETAASRAPQARSLPSQTAEAAKEEDFAGADGSIGASGTVGAVVEGRPEEARASEPQAAGVVGETARRPSPPASPPTSTPEPAAPPRDGPADEAPQRQPKSAVLATLDSLEVSAVAETVAPDEEAEAEPADARDDASAKALRKSSTASGPSRPNEPSAQRTRAFAARSAAAPAEADASPARLQQSNEMAEADPGAPGAEDAFRTILAQYRDETAEVDAERRSRECDAWRQFVERHGESPTGSDGRYRLARCSIALAEARPSESARDQAVRDAEVFLSREPTGERADEIREAVGRLQ